MADRYRRVQGTKDTVSGDAVEKWRDMTTHHAREVYVAASASKSAATGHVHEPAADTAAVVTLTAGGAGVSHVLGMITWSYDADPTGGELKIEDGAGSTVFKADITSKGPGYVPFTPALKGSANTAMVATLAAGGSGVSGVVSVHAWTE